MCHSATIIPHGVETASPQSRPTRAVLPSMTRPEQVAFLTGTLSSEIPTNNSHEATLLTFGSGHTDPKSIEGIDASPAVPLRDVQPSAFLS
jgi:hypothetical protein